MIKFALYSANISATLNPWAADPAPTTLIDFAEEPLSGQYDPNAGSYGRGTRIQTLGGAIDQDFGQFAHDGKISLSLTDVKLSSTLVANLKSLFDAIATQYYFTDSVNCWKVKFAKPDGLKVYQNLWYKAAANENVYSVELLLNVDSKEI